MKLFLFILFISSVLGSGNLVCPPPRVSMMTLAPLTPYPPTLTVTEACGNSSYENTVGSFAAGGPLTITWNILAGSPNPAGRVRIALSYRDFVHDPFSANIIVNVTSAGNVGMNSMTIMLPAYKTSTTTVLQWLLESDTEKVSYMSCSDIDITPETTLLPTCSAAVAPPTKSLAITLVPKLMLFLVVTVIFMFV